MYLVASGTPEQLGEIEAREMYNFHRVQDKGFRMTICIVQASNSEDYLYKLHATFKKMTRNHRFPKIGTLLNLGIGYNTPHPRWYWL
uniref:Helitron_like_N domain-containing protein n=1 Tax=Panagrellus redivivus TaxID=6233 RepID=A0A7E4VJN4_PANRE